VLTPEQAKAVTVPRYRVTFARIGRNHDVPALVTTAVDADDLAEQVFRYARPRLGSRDVDVTVDFDKAKGTIYAGMRSGVELQVEDRWVHPAAGEPFINEEIGARPGFVVGECGHAVAESEWRAGFRTCERCPDGAR
jgi:hypothetical protein